MISSAEDKCESVKLHALLLWSLRTVGLTFHTKSVFLERFVERENEDTEYVERVLDTTGNVIFP